MEQKIRCIYRKKKCFKLCNRTTIKNSFYCCYHIHSKKKHLCKIFFKLFENKHDLKGNDIYIMYNYILKNTPDYDDVFINILFIDLLKMIPIVKLTNIYKNYINNITDYSIKYLNDNKTAIYNQIYLLNYNTFNFNNKCNINNLIYFQNIVKYKLLCNSNSVKLSDIYNNLLNDEDVFTSVNISEIHPRKLFTIKDIKGVYAFDIVELEYFVRNCLKDNIEPYNPYTREKLNDKIIWRMNMKIKYNNIQKKTDECRWTTEMNAYTDLSIEIERRGFYNNPEWFKKMSRADLFKCIKLFRDFSLNIEESKKYFLNINNDNIDTLDTFTYDFCKESIKLFNECNDELYILCCNYMKSLALCSNDFYNNIPDWLSIYETTSYVSGLSNFTSFISTFLNNDINNINGDDLLNSGDIVINNHHINDQNNILTTNYDMNIDIPDIQQPINPSNNFLLYYYVEYM